MFGKLNNQEIEDLISQQIVGRIGCHADDITYVVPVSYGYDGNYVYGHTFEGMKMNMMRKNPKLCFQVDNTKNMANWKSVVCWGEFEELKEEKDCREALRVLSLRLLPIISSQTTHISPEWPFDSGNTDGIKGIFFRIKLVEKTGRFEKSETQVFFAT